ncbi:uncharacterized protein LOC108670258 [Hyalella azteca]|uniref:Uncharacterized protein LOC108670258 n=1 Tax=Hyalella azteca TaxID=294128 RepID=A0A8B7NHT9_HYAAZ|nr:uncharacterized protein LOC108670258 [Hyalella azteca]
MMSEQQQQMQDEQMQEPASAEAGAGDEGGSQPSADQGGTGSGAAGWPLRLWTHELTQRLLQKVQQRKRLLLDPKLRRRTVYAEVAAEFQDEGICFTSCLTRILEDIYSEVGDDGVRVLLPTSSLNPLVHSPPRQERVRHSKRLRTRPARLKGHVDYADVSLRCEMDAADSLERVRAVLLERLEDVAAQRTAATAESVRAWTAVNDALTAMADNLATLNSSVLMLAHTATSVMAALNRVASRK